MPAPTGAASQSFCNAATVADLKAKKSDFGFFESTIKWYSAASGGTLLPSATALTSGTKYSIRLYSNNGSFGVAVYAARLIIKQNGDKID